MQRPTDAEYAPFYAPYVALVPETDILPVLEQQIEEIRRLAAAVPSPRETYRYAEGKWSIRQVLGHLVDGERVFGYRAFCISRGEQAPLPSFDENQYVSASRFDATPLLELADELALVRRSNLVVLRRLEEARWARAGIASGKPVSVRALAWVMAGHPRHHLGILKERYGVA
jgi:uncharacterized damage-inducible protein DinB